MKLVVALLLNYVTAKKFVLDRDEVPGEINSGHYSWKLSGSNSVNESEWVDAAPKGYSNVQLSKHKQHHKAKIEVQKDGRVEGELPESKKNQDEIFDKRYDYDNANDQSSNVRAELAQVHIIPITETKNPKCKPHDFTRAHWTAKLSETGEIVEDTRQKFGEENPRQFKVGDYQATRCLDLVLPQMRVGDKLQVLCPAKFAYGGQHVYTHFGSAMIPENSDLTYEIELISCMKKDWNKVHKKLVKKEAEKKEEQEIEALPKPKLPVKKSMVQEKLFVEAQFKRIDELKDILNEREIQMKDQEAQIQKLNDFYLKKKALLQPVAQQEGESIAEKAQFNKKEHQALADGRLQLQQAEKSAKAAEQAIINEEKVVHTASSLVQGIQIMGESSAEKQQINQLEQAQQSQEEANKSIDQQTLERESNEMKQEMEQPDTEEEKEEDSSPEASKILGESQEDSKTVGPHLSHKIKVDETKTDEQVAIEKAEKSLKQKKTKDADNKIVAAAEQKKNKIAQKQLMKVEKKAQVQIDALTEVMKTTEATTEQALALKDKQCFYIESAGKDGRGSNIVLEVGRDDAYAPRKTGVYNVALAARSQADPEEPEQKAQQWFYNTKTQTLHSMLYPKKALFEGNNNNLIVFKNKGLKQQKFAYDKVNLDWSNKFTKKSVGIKDFKQQMNTAVDIYKAGQNVGTAPFEAEKPQQWLVKYCEQA